MRSSHRSLPRRDAFSLIEIIVVVTIVALLFILGSAGLKRVFKSSEISKCAANLRTIGGALNLYAAEHDGSYPPFPTNSDVSQGAYTICDILADGSPRWKHFGLLYGQGYLDDPQVFYCPSARKGAFDYASQWQAKSKGSNSFSGQFRIGYYQRIVDSSFPVPGQLKANEGKLRVVMTDANSTENSLHPETSISRPSSIRRGINVLYSDGHVKYDASGLRWNNPGQWAYGGWEADP